MFYTGKALPAVGSTHEKIKSGDFVIYTFHPALCIPLPHPGVMQKDNLQEEHHDFLVKALP